QTGADETAIEQGALAGFDLDTATLGGEESVDQVPSEAPAEVPGFPEEPAASMGGEMESLGEESLDDLNLDQFSLPESAEEFGEQGPAPAPKARPAAPQRPSAPERKAPERRAPPQQPRAAAAPSEPGLGEGEIELTPEQFAQLKKTLES